MPKIDQAAKVWQKDMAERVGRAVQTRRQDLKMTAAVLAKRTAELGYPVSRVAIGKLENNHREGKFDLAELLVLAAALDIAPLELLYPGAPDQVVELLPSQTATTLDASTWFIGNPDWLVTLQGQLDTLARAITGPPRPGKKGALGAIVHKREETQ
jgi:transcriptional regulator with XRE-family HTH domain